MLDEPDSPQSDAASNDLPSPPRGRRAASRPAGPPNPIASAPVPPPVDEPPVEPIEAPVASHEHEATAEDESPDARTDEPDPSTDEPEESMDQPGASADQPVEPADQPVEPADQPDEPADQPDESTDQPGEAAAASDVAAEQPSATPDDSDDFESELQARIEAQLIPRATTEAADARPARRRTRKRAEPTGDSGAAEGPSRIEDSRDGRADLESGAVSLVAGSEDTEGDGQGSTEPESATGNTSDQSTEGHSTQNRSAAERRTADESTGAESTGGEGTGDESTADQDPEDSDAEDQGDDSSDGAESGSRRRRRRRGGRRRRRSGSNGSGEQSGDDNEGPDHNGDSGDVDSDDDGDSDDHGEQDDTADTGDDSGDDDADSDDSGTDGSEGESAAGSGESRRRRRRRRRRGEDTGGSDDPDTDVVVKVREPRRTKATDEITGIEGSTRLEAKRQRRREGRAAGRRRTPILSEAEFLARRESVDRTMVIRQNADLSQIAVLEDGVLVEHYVDRASVGSLIGNVYLGRIQNVLPSMEAAFVDIGRGRNAVLYAGEVDWDSFGAEGQARKVEKVLKSGQAVLVQVTKDPVGAKGARLTNHISLPGRYIVYSPGGHLSGISRKLPDTERKRLKEILGELIGDDASVIVRTAAEGSSEEELVRDVNRLKAQWEIIEKKVKGGQAPQQLYAEPDATVRIVRDLFTEDFSKLVIDGNGRADDAYETVTAYVSHVAPHLNERIERWDGVRGDVFAAHRVDEQIAKALERKVFLPSGGSLIIERTEAMTVIDVNTGKFTGSGGNLEATVTSNNLEAAEEVVRQLRLRDIGGIIVIDFIDMVLPSNRELLLRRLVECLGRDRTRHQVAEVTSLGLVQMTRKKIGTGLAEAFTETCDCCKGRGYKIHEVPVESQSQADGGDRRRGRGRSGNGNGKSDASRPEHGAATETADD